MIKSYVDTSTLEGVAVEYYNNAYKLAEELQAVGFDNLEVKKGVTSWCDFDLFLTVDNVVYTVTRNYQGNVSLSRFPYNIYSNVSSSKRSEVYKNTFVSNNIKVITKKKILTAIAEELAYHECMATLNDESLDKIQFYLSRIRQLEKDYTVSYMYNYDRTNITGGRVIKNGVELYFEIDYSSGYVSETLRLEHTWYDNKIEAFKLLSDNKY